MEKEMPGKLIKIVVIAALVVSALYVVTEATAGVMF